MRPVSKIDESYWVITHSVSIMDNLCVPVVPSDSRYKIFITSPMHLWVLSNLFCKLNHVTVVSVLMVEITIQTLDEMSWISCRTLDLWEWNPTVSKLENCGVLLLPFTPPPSVRCGSLYPTLLTTKPSEKETQLQSS